MQMQQLKIFLYPLFLLVFLFTLDKISILPMIYELGRAEPTPLENVRMGMNNIYADRSKSDNQDSAIFFGSSRTDAIRYVDNKSIQESMFLDEESKTYLNKFSFEFRPSAKASDLFYSYFLLKDLIQSGYKPGTVFFEISPEMLNRNNPFHATYHFQNNIFHYRELVGIYSFFDEDHILSNPTLRGILFPSFHYRFSIYAVLKRLFSSSDYLEDDFSVQIFQSMPSAVYTSDYVDIHEDVTDSEDYKSKILGYSNYMFEEFIARDLAFSQVELNVLDAILRLSKSTDLNIVFWIPRTHKQYTQLGYSKGLEEFRALIHDRVSSQGLKLIDLRRIDPACRYYTDSSHTSPRCATEVVYQLLRESSR